MTDIYKFLTENDIPFERHDHAAVLTCEEADRLVPDLGAAQTKNLFLRDNKGRRHFLVIVGYKKAVDLKALKDIIGSSKLSFGSAERLVKYLGVTPGAVSLLAMINDTNKNVELIFDKELWQEEAFRFHPLVNTSTLVISKEGIERFLDGTGHDVQVVEMPG